MAKDKKEKVSHEGATKKLEKEPLPKLKPGMTIRVHQRITELGPKGEKQRIQVYEGLVIACKHGEEMGATITVRKISEGIGVEKIFPIHSPNIIKIQPVKQAKTKKAKLYYLRGYKKRLEEKKIEAVNQLS